MLKNYLLTSLRNLYKHFVYSLINMVGLGLGLATCLLLAIWIRHELSFDRFHEKADQIYRASLEYSFGGQTSKTSVSPTALLPALQKNFSEVENGVRLYNPSSYRPFLVKKDDKLFQEEKFHFADSTFFKIFSFKLLRGDREKVLTLPKSVVLSQSMSRKYFGAEDPLGKTIQVNNRDDYTVTGMMEDVPDNSLLQFDFVASFSSLEQSREQIWWSANYQTFLLLNSNADVPSLQEKTNALVKKELASELTNPNDYVKYNLMPLTDIYLRSDSKESEVVSSILYVYAFGGIAALILIIASINYINLATAKAADRAKEVGIRKVIGALKRQLFFQFIAESLIITFFSSLLAFLLAQLALPMFNSITGKHFTPVILAEPRFLFFLLLALLLIAFLAGAYPAFTITAFQPASVLKGNFKSSGRGIWLRQTLVVFQFFVSIVLIVSTLVILKQLRYLRNTRLGYDTENVIVLPLDQKTREVFGSLRTELLRSGKVAEVGRGGESPVKINGGYTIALEGTQDEHGMLVTAMTADTTLIPSLGMQIVAGRNFNDTDFKRYQADTVFAFILNEKACKEWNLEPDKAVGTKIRMNGRRGEIVGVVKDFHFTSFHAAISPLVLFNEAWQDHFIFVKLKPGDINESLATLKKICTQVIPHRPFDYEFLDQQYVALYSSEQRMGVISSLFSSIAIVIACLGLSGLVAFAASQKTKEIGIRKVMGATASSIVVLITKDYARLVFISIVVGLPLAYWVIEKWFLSNFAYRTEIGFWPFVIAALSCIFIALATASYQAIKAAFINPSESLRRE